MKNMFKLLIAAGVLTPLAAVAQPVIVSNPSTSLTFNALIAGMESDVDDLFVFDIWNPTEGPAYSAMYFDINTSDWVTGGNDFSDAGHLNFVEISPNVPAFDLTGSMDVGFFGNSSIDLNEMIIELLVPDLPDATLNIYQNYVPGATATANISLNQIASAVIRFTHDNSENGAATQADDAKFKMFQGINETGEFTGEYVFAIDDRSVDSIDYDDGFFYVSGDITPVPEPSHIAALGLIGMGGFLYLRRRIKAKKA